MVKQYIYITGCDSGFGRMAVDMFANKGYGVFAGVFLDKSMDTLKAECSALVVPVKLDVSKEASVLEAANVIKEHLKKEAGSQLYGVINNAGILVQPCPAEWQSLKDFRDMFEVNVLGTVAVTQSVLPLIRASQGRIVCTSSIAGRIGLPTQAAYCVSKYGVQAYADVLRKDMYAFGVTVHIVEPGVFPNTNLYERFQTGLDSVWARLDPQIKADYGEEHYKFQRALLAFALKEFGTLDSSLVPKAYVEAITSKQPLYRYRVGNDSKYLITMLANAHESTSDGAMTMSDPRLPWVKPASAPANGKARAWATYDKGWKRFIIVSLFIAWVAYRVKKSYQ